MLQNSVALGMVTTVALLTLACATSATSKEGEIPPTEQRPAPLVESVCSGYAAVLEKAHSVATGGQSLYEAEFNAELRTLSSAAEQAGQPLMARTLDDLALPFLVPHIAVQREGARGRMESGSRQMIRLCTAEGYESDWYDDPKVIADVFCEPLIGYKGQIGAGIPRQRC